MSAILTITSKVREEIIPFVDVIYFFSEVEAYKAMHLNLTDFMSEYFESNDENTITSTENGIFIGCETDYNYIYFSAKVQRIDDLKDRDSIFSIDAV